MHIFDAILGLYAAGAKRDTTPLHTMLGYGLSGQVRLSYSVAYFIGLVSVITETVSPHIRSLLVRLQLRAIDTLLLHVHRQGRRELRGQRRRFGP